MDLKNFNDKIIVSKDNTKVKLCQKLKQKKYREEFSQTVVEGYRVFSQIIEYGILPNFVFFEEDILKNNNDFEQLFEKFYDISFVLKKNIFENIADTKNSQGLIAVFDIPDFEKNIFEKPNCRVFLLDRLQDPGNVGTVIRTADAVGYDAILYTKGTVDIFSEKVNRASMGANFSVPTFEADEKFILKLKEKGFLLISTMLDDTAILYNKIDYGSKSIIVLGNEANGVSGTIADISDCRAYIPIKGKAESLNVAVAGGIIAYKSME